MQGSPRKNGNTKQFSALFIDELQANGVDVQEEWIYDKELKPCLGCGVCQDRTGQLGCVHEDDFARLVEQMLEADVTVFSTPIYACFPPGPVKVFLDRQIYAPVKLYGKEKASSLLAQEAAAVNVFINTRSLPGNVAAQTLEEKAEAMRRDYIPRAEKIADAVMEILRRKNNG